MSLVFVDREAAYPNKYKVTPEDGGAEYYVVLERADEAVTPGTPLNAETFNTLVDEFERLHAENKTAIENHAGNKENPHAVTAEQVGAVPNTRTINGKPLTEDVVITAEDIGATGNESLDAHINNMENPHEVTAEQVGAAPVSHVSDTDNPHGVTKAQVGLGNVPNVSTNNQVPTYTQASSLANLVSGEKLSVSLGKIMKAIADLISHLANKSNPHSVSLSQLGVTATAAELNKLDGVTATTAELNYVDGVTSNIQTQLNGKAASSHSHSYLPLTGGSITGNVNVSRTYNNGYAAFYKNNSETADYGMNFADYAADGSRAMLVLSKNTGCAQITMDSGASYEDIMLANYNATYHAWSKKVSGVAQWLNPPVVVGTEYCTLEHYLGAQVYTKVVDCGTSSDSKVVNYGVTAGKLLRSVCIIGNLPARQRAAGETSTSSANYQAYYPTTTSVTLYCGSSRVGVQTYCQIWYTK